MIILLLTAPLALIVIGPFGTYLNDLVAAGAEFISGKASWLIPLLMGAFQPFLVVTGTAWAMTPIATMQLTNNGSEMINGPGMLASNIAQGAATLCVAVKSKNKNLKQLSASAGTTALLGITEPSLYGVTLKLKKPLIAAMIGGGCAGIYAGLSGLVRYAFVSPGLAALPALIGKNPMNIIHALITCLIAFVVTFVLTWVLGFEDPIDEESIKTSIANKKETTISDTNIIEIASPLSGKLIPLTQVNDDVFSGELLGKGIAILPNNGNVLSPNDQIFITLIDHISYALTRYKKNITLQNRLLWELKKFSPEEFKIGKYAVEYINDKLNVNLPEEEAGNIAFHFVNAQTDEVAMQNTMLTIKMLKDIFNINLI
ncbi:phosphoenolpyruvate-dependent sugar phosphotransferase system, EIIA 1 family protein [Clostridium sporogenes]|nr:phosphoenolpyruvate-dependent sugar phosphotransferase system, EIIA 1 family protein [Clostridium sporogenes]